MNRISGGGQRPYLPMSIRIVPAEDLRFKLLLRYLAAGSGQILLSAPGTFGNIGLQKKFPLRLRKYHCALIASFGDDFGKSCCKIPLHLHQTLPKQRLTGYMPYFLGHFRIPNPIGKIPSIHQRPQKRAFMFKMKLGCLHHLLQRLGIVQVSPSLHGRGRDCAVHRSGIQKYSAQPGRKHLRDGAFARSCRSVDGNDP